MRELPEWVGKHDDEAIPPRVRVRIFERDGGICQGCRRIIRAGERWDLDHRRALIAGGKHAESNLQVLCPWCHADKTADDVAEKSSAYRKRAKHIGVPLKKKRRFGWG